MEEKVHPIIQKQYDSLTDEQKEQLLLALRPLTEINIPEPKIPDSLPGVISDLNETGRNVAKILSAINLSVIVENIAKPKRGTDLYHGVEIEKYRKIRKIKASTLSGLLFRYSLTLILSSFSLKEGLEIHSIFLIFQPLWKQEYRFALMNICLRWLY